MNEMEKLLQEMKTIAERDPLMEETRSIGNTNPGRFVFPDVQSFYGYALKSFPHQLAVVQRNLWQPEDQERFMAACCMICDAIPALEQLSKAFQLMRDTVKYGDLGFEARDVERMLAFLRDATNFVKFFAKAGFHRMM